MVEDISVNFMGKLLNEGKREVTIGGTYYSGDDGDSPGQLAVPVVDIFSLLLRQGVDAVAEGQQGPVDVSPLLQSQPRILKERQSQMFPCPALSLHLGVGGSLAARQVYHVKSAVLEVLFAPGCLRHVDHEESVGPGAGLVGRRRLLCPLLVPPLEESHHLLGRLGGHL